MTFEITPYNMAGPWTLSFNIDLSRPLTEPVRPDGAATWEYEFKFVSLPTRGEFIASHFIEWLVNPRDHTGPLIRGSHSLISLKARVLTGLHYLSGDSAAPGPIVKLSSLVMTQESGREEPVVAPDRTSGKVAYFSAWAGSQSYVSSSDGRVVNVIDEFRGYWRDFRDRASGRFILKKK